MSTRIALATDIHVGYDRRNSGERTLRRFEQLIAAINAANVDFVLLGGDMTEGASAQQMRRFAEMARQFQAPRRAIPGNHDTGNRKLPHQENAADEVSAERVAFYEEQFGPSFWREEINGAVRVLGVNASLFGSGLEREAEQWQWLGAALDKPAPLPTLLATHYPLYLETPDENGEEEWNADLQKTYWTIEPRSRRRLLELIARGGVRAVLSGHLHHPLRHERDGVLFISSPAVAFALPRTQPPGEVSWPGWTLLTVSGDEVAAEFQKLPDTE